MASVATIASLSKEVLEKLGVLAPEDTMNAADAQFLQKTYLRIYDELGTRGANGFDRFNPPEEVHLGMIDLMAWEVAPDFGRSRGPDEAREMKIGRVVAAIRKPVLSDPEVSFF